MAWLAEQPPSGHKLLSPFSSPFPPTFGQRLFAQVGGLHGLAPLKLHVVELLLGLFLFACVDDLGGLCWRGGRLFLGGRGGRLFLGRGGGCAACNLFAVRLDLESEAAQVVRGGGGGG